MVETPIDYTFGSADPYKMAMEGFQGGLDASAQQAQQVNQAQQMQLAQSQDARAQTQLGINQQTADQQQTLFAQQQSDYVKQQAARSDLAQLTALGSRATTSDYAAFLAKHPDMSDEAQTAWGAFSTAQQDNLLKFGAQVYSAISAGDVETAKALLKERQTASENSGDKQSADMIKGLLMQIEVHPESAATALRLFGDASTGGAFSKMIDTANGVAEQPKVGLVPYPGTDAAGNTIMMQTNDRGEAVATKLPDGVTWDLGAKAGAAQDAKNQSNIASGGTAAEAVAMGAGTGANLAAAQLALPTAIANAETAMAQIKAIRDDPALGTVTGSLQGRAPEWMFAFDQKSTDLLVKMKQLQGQAFLLAFDQLRGAGAITVIEGEKATAAKARLDRAQSTETYQAALDELTGILKRGIEIAKTKAGAGGASATEKPTIAELTAQANAAIDAKDQAELDRIMALIRGFK